ncbi:hypothetical protein [Gilvimarinus xylanilyticus]|uniref:Uncharacterized protein n=1 Tax=Gilvimarinus xylanilyticus TaxID=2944139 RepID=A0A9X2KUK0_9GAMM|nr:hypothetical protein [Gilvimarinus xylanilyticus]MCP8900374.1 hypothetical protein [Gilvimarinus xylanilyticus]
MNNKIEEIEHLIEGVCRSVSMSDAKDKITRLKFLAANLDANAYAKDKLSEAINHAINVSKNGSDKSRHTQLMYNSWSVFESIYNDTEV